MRFSIVESSNYIVLILFECTIMNMFPAMYSLADITL